jgi:hypothetical protein
VACVLDERNGWLTFDLKLFTRAIEPVRQKEQAEYHVQDDENVSRLHRIFLYQFQLT